MGILNQKNFWPTSIYQFEHSGTPYCLSYHFCLNLSRMLGHINTYRERSETSTDYIYIYNNYIFKPLTLFGTEEDIFVGTDFVSRSFFLITKL